MRTYSGTLASNRLDYQDILLDMFVSFLKQNGASKKTIQNYRTDTKHFLLWLEEMVVIPSHSSISDISQFSTLLTNQNIADYKVSLRIKNTPINTINRRLSALRSLISCLKISGYIFSTQTLTIQNISPEHSSHTNTMTHIHTTLEAWASHLRSRGKSHDQIQIHIQDVRHFLIWKLKK